LTIKTGMPATSDIA